MTQAWDKEKIWVSDRNRTMTSRTPGGRSIHWTTRTHGEQGHFYWVHMWQASCILLGSALPSSESIFVHFWPFLSQCNRNIILLQNKLPHCQLSPSHSTGGYLFAKYKSFVPQYPGPPYWIRILKKHFPLTDIPDTTNSELRSTQVRCMNRQSHSVGLNWIEFHTAEMQRMKQALLRFSDSTLHMATVQSRNADFLTRGKIVSSNQKSAVQMY